MSTLDKLQAHNIVVGSEEKAVMWPELDQLAELKALKESPHADNIINANYLKHFYSYHNPLTSLQTCTDLSNSNDNSRPVLPKTSRIITSSE